MPASAVENRTFVVNYHFDLEDFVLESPGPTFHIGWAKVFTFINAEGWEVVSTVAAFYGPAASFNGGQGFQASQYRLFVRRPASQPRVPEVVSAVP